MITQPMPFEEAPCFLVEKEQLPAEWDAATWQAQEPDFRAKAFFISRVENARFIDRAQTLIFDYMAKVQQTVLGPDGVERKALSVGGRGDFVKLMRDFMIEEGMAKTEEFKDVNQKDVADIRSMARLNLIFDINIRQAYGFGQWKQGMSPAVLRAFPAARLIRERGVKVPRIRHQSNIGQVRLKTDFEWWAGFINSKDIGGFDVPWGPYGFGSGVNQEDVSKKDAEKEGLAIDAEKESDKRSTDGTRASTRNMAPELKQKLLEELRNGKKPSDPKEAARKAAALARRDAMERGLSSATKRGDDVAAKEYRNAIRQMGPEAGLKVIEKKDSIILENGDHSVL